MRWSMAILSVSLGAATLAGCLGVDEPAGDEPPDTVGRLEATDGGGGGGGGGGGPPPPPPSVFLSSLGRGGTGAIRDLKFEKGDTSSQVPLDGYTLIPADLNKGAGGTYIYLTFTRLEDKLQVGTQCGWENNAFVTGLFADDFRAIDAVQMKGTCAGLGDPWTPIWESTGDPLWPWKHPDLNDGSGGRYIYAWQERVGTGAPLTEVGVLSGNTSAIQCPAGWTKVDQDLNQGAGGDYIYFCYKQ